MKSKAIIAGAILIIASVLFTAFIREDNPQNSHYTMIILALKSGKDISIRISERGQEYKEELIKTDKSDGDLGPLIAFVDQQYIKGWKLHSSNFDATTGIYYFLFEK